MKSFIIKNLHDIKTLSLPKSSDGTYMIGDSEFKEIPIIRCYSDDYMCLAKNDIDTSYENMLYLFKQGGNDDAVIGAVSVIFDTHLSLLLASVKNNELGTKQLTYLYETVLPYYLPMILPKSELKTYIFPENMSEDIYVKLFYAVRSTLI